MAPHQRIRALLGVASVVVVHAFSSVNARAQTNTSFPPLGKLVDIGGWRLHLHCTGEARASQPTVILEAGIGDFSAEWSLVQPGVAQFARVCSYDRADEGWSDYGPHPRTMHQIVYELHTLLDKAEVRPPYVLVGHSYGGWLVRIYKSVYPSEVAGMVLVEAGADDPQRMLGDGVMRHSSDLVTGRPIPAVKTSNPTRENDIPPGVMQQLQAAAQQFGPRANEPPRNKLPIEVQRARTWVYSQPKHWAQNDNPVEAEELAGLRAERVRDSVPYGDMPFVVITRGLSDEDGPDGKQIAPEHRKDHEAVSKLSRAGKLVVAEKSGHHVQIEQPDLVISAIRDVVSAVRK